jgi:hypothetical protein
VNNLKVFVLLAGMVALFGVVGRRRQRALQAEIGG